MGVAGLTVTATPFADAQQVLEVDYTTGRTIIDDEWRSMGSDLMAIDWNRAILYVADGEEPEGIMAFSLETGEWIRTIQTPSGDGPNEFPKGRMGMAVAPSGGLYVSGFLRVVEYDSLGVSLNSWTPTVPESQRVCTLAGAPAVPTQGGVVRRAADGSDESVGPVLAQGRGIVASTVEAGVTIGRRIGRARIACTDDEAFVVMTYDEGPDSVFVYHRNGEAGRLAVPTEFTEGLEDCVRQRRSPDGQLRGQARRCPAWSRRLVPSFDDRSNVVLLGSDDEVHGTIINPDTGCYAILRTPSIPRDRRVARIHADSVLVFRNNSDQQDLAGFRNATVIYANSATGVALHPLRRVSGEPCPGMLPTVNE